MIYSDLNNAPFLDDYVDSLRKKELSLKRFRTRPLDFKFNFDGTVTINSVAIQANYSLNLQAEQYLCQLLHIPCGLVSDDDKELKALILNFKFKNRLNKDAMLTITLQENEIYRISASTLLSIPSDELLHCISYCKPAHLKQDDLRIIEFQNNGVLDVSIIARNLTSQPVKGDTVAFGVNIRRDYHGAIQIQGAAFRLACSNGAINRVCTHEKQHLKRPGSGQLGRSVFLENVDRASKDAWGSWKSHADGLEMLTRTKVSTAGLAGIAKRLTVKPFFLSQKHARLVTDYVGEHHGQSQVTLYDLYNAMTYIGTHSMSLPYGTRARLRLGAGEISRRNSKVCDACRQVVFEDVNPR